MSVGYWLRPTVALTNPLPAYAYTGPTVAQCGIGFPRRRTADGCPVSHWDVLGLYGLRLPYKSQSWFLFFGELCVLHHPLFHFSTIAFELGSDLSSFHSTMHLILHCMAVKASV